MHDLSRRADQKYNSGLFHFQKESGVSEEPDPDHPEAGRGRQSLQADSLEGL